MNILYPHHFDLRSPSSIRRIRRSKILEFLTKNIKIDKRVLILPPSAKNVQNQVGLFKEPDSNAEFETLNT